MAKKGQLFLLIKSLSKSEKRYFRIYTQTTGGHANYLRLFDAIEGQQEYDEAEIREQFKGEKFLSQLHVTKIYLTELILKALRNYHADRSVDFKLLNLLQDIEMLFNKELYDLCYHKIMKAETLAARYEKLALLIQIYFWKKKLALTVLSLRKNVHSLLIKEKETIEQVHVLNTYWQHTVNLDNLIFDESFLGELANKKTEIGYALQSKVLHYHLLYSRHLVKGENQKAEEHVSGLITLLEKHPDRIKEDPHPYVTAIGNKIGLYLSDKRWEEIPALIFKIREVPAKYQLKSESKFTLRLWLRMYNVELEMYRDSRQLEKGIALIEEITRFIEKRRKIIPEDYLLLFYYQFANIFFLKKEFKKSLRWLNEIINSNFGDTKEDIQAYARILNLIVHFELNNIVILRYAVDSCRRFLKKKSLEIRSGRELLNLFSKLGHVNPEEYPTLFKKAYARIFPPDYREKQDYIDVKGWMEEKIR